MKSKNEYGYIAILFFAWGIVFFDRMVMLYLAPFLEKSLNLNGAQLGAIAGATAISWAISAFLFGSISDKIGRKIVVIPAMITFSIICIISGWAKNYEQLLILRVLMGIAEGPCWSVLTALGTELSPKERQGRNVSIVIAGGAVIALLLGPFITAIFANKFGWAMTFVAAGIPGLILAFLIFKFIPEPMLRDKSF